MSGSERLWNSEFDGFTCTQLFVSSSNTTISFACFVLNSILPIDTPLSLLHAW
jgi:hypothetical protein